MFHRMVIALVFLLSLSEAAQAQSQFGRYVGVVKNPQLGQDQLAKLDFVVEKQTSSELKLIALLSLYFGDFESREYVTYHFDDVSFNILSGQLVFDQPDQEVTLVADEFGGGRLRARIRSVSAGDIGTLELAQSDAVMPTEPLLQPLWGEYRGTCDGIGTILQIQTSRSSEDSSRMGNPFGTYETTAQMAEVDPAGCLGASACVRHVYTEGTYDFFTGSLQLTGRSRDQMCKVGPRGLVCNGCTLTRSSREAAVGSSFSYPKKAGGFAPSTGGATVPAASLSGTYRGYLFHERLGVYQPVSVNLVAFQRPGTSGSQALFLSATSAMYFGGFDQTSAVTAKYNEKEFALLSPQIVLEQAGGDVDGIIQLTKLGDGMAQGTWYSRLYGRVGTFELRNDVTPDAPSDAKIMQRVDGVYHGGQWRLDLKSVREATPISTVNPFFPMNFKGAMRIPDATANIRIAGGTFDFYTGKIYLRLEDESLFSGYFTADSRLFLKRPTPGTARTLVPHAFQEYERINP